MHDADVEKYKKLQDNTIRKTLKDMNLTSIDALSVMIKLHVEMILCLKKSGFDFSIIRDYSEWDDETFMALLDIACQICTPVVIAAPKK